MALSGNTQFKKVTLSGSPVTGEGSPSGRNISIAATTSPGTTIHTVSTDPAITDELWLYVSNLSTTTAYTLYLCWGGTSSSDIVPLTVSPGNVEVPLVLGRPLLGAATPLVVSAYVSSGGANSLVVNGFVNRMQ